MIKNKSMVLIKNSLSRLRNTIILIALLMVFAFFIHFFLARGTFVGNFFLPFCFGVMFNKMMTYQDGDFS